MSEQYDEPVADLDDIEADLDEIEAEEDELEELDTPEDLSDESEVLETPSFDDDVVEATEGSAEGTAPVDADTDDDVLDAEVTDEPVADLVEAEGEVADDAAAEGIDETVDTLEEGEAKDTPESVDEDPLEAFRRELWAKAGDWFVVHTYSGMENRVKSNLENRIVSLNMEDYIHEIVVPIEDIVEIKNGQRRTRKKPALPGYVLVRMDLTDESWSTVRHTPSVTGFVGNSHQPVPLSMDEVENMLAPAVVAAAEIAAAAAGTQVGRATASGLLKLIPGAGSVAGGLIGAGVASTYTYAMGQAWLVVCQRAVTGSFGKVGSALDTDAVREAFSDELKKRLKVRGAQKS